MWEDVLKQAGAAAERKDWAAAELTLMNVLDKPDVPPTVWFQLGKIMLMQRKLCDAATWFRKTAEAVPHVPDGWFELGRALAAGGNYSEAVLALHRAIALDPDNVQAHRFACVAAREAGDIPTADHHVSELVRLGVPLQG